MRRSSRILGFLLITVLPVFFVSATSQARGFGRANTRVGVIPSAGTPWGGFFRPGGLRFRSGLRPSGFPRGRSHLGRFGRYGFGGFGGYGLGGVDLPFGDAPPTPYGVEPAAAPQHMFIPVVLPPPVCPLIIAVGRGLRQPARARIVYGQEPVCRR